MKKFWRGGGENFIIIYLFTSQPNHFVEIKMVDSLKDHTLTSLMPQSIKEKLWQFIPNLFIFFSVSCLLQKITIFFSNSQEKVAIFVSNSQLKDLNFRQ